MDNTIADRLTRLPLMMGISVMIAAGILSWGIYASRVQDETLVVTGSAKRAVTADTAKWQANFSRPAHVADLKEGYAQMARDQAALEEFFAAQGIAGGNITVSSVSMEQLYKPDGGAPDQYILRQNVQLTLDDPEKMNELSKNIQPLIDQGIVFSSFPVEYYYTALADLRVELLAEAVQDAEKRARAIVESTGKRLGSLSSASMGVVQVLAPNSIEISDYGSYDTSSRDKEVMVTVRTAFKIK